MDPIPGTFYFKGVILVRAPDPPFYRVQGQRKDVVPPLRPPIAPLKHPPSLAPPPNSGLRLVSIA